MNDEDDGVDMCLNDMIYSMFQSEWCVSMHSKLHVCICVYVNLCVCVHVCVFVHVARESTAHLK